MEPNLFLTPHTLTHQEQADIYTPSLKVSRWQKEGQRSFVVFKAWTRTLHQGDREPLDCPAAQGVGAEAGSGEGFCW